MAGSLSSSNALEMVHILSNVLTSFGFANAEASSTIALLAKQSTLQLFRVMPNTPTKPTLQKNSLYLSHISSNLLSKRTAGPNNPKYLNNPNNPSQGVSDESFTSGSSEQAGLAQASLALLQNVSAGVASGMVPYQSATVLESEQIVLQSQVFTEASALVMAMSPQGNGTNANHSAEFQVLSAGSGSALGTSSSSTASAAQVSWQTKINSHESAVSSVICGIVYPSDL